MQLNEGMIELIKEVMQKQEPVYVAGQGLPITFQTQINEVQAEHVLLKNAVSPFYIHDFMQSQQFTLQVGTLRLESPRLGSDGEHMVFPLLGQLTPKDIRREHRLPLTKEDEAVCVLLNPFDLQTILQRPIIEMSPAGLSLRSKFPSKLFSPGMLLPDLKIYVKHEHRLSHTGEVIYCRQLLNLKGESFFQIGIKFHLDSYLL